MLLKEVNMTIFSHEKLDYETLDSSPVFNMNINEALRFYSPFSNSSPRKIMKDCTLGKYKIKKGANLVWPIGNLMIQDKVFANAKQFEAERFSEENRKAMKKISHIPFSSGKRRCIGAKMGEMMIKVLVSMTLRKF